MGAPDLGSKTTISFSTSVGGTDNFSVMSASVNGISREVIPTSHLLTGVANTFLPSDRYDGGELSLTMQMDHTQWALMLADMYGTGTATPTSGLSEPVSIVLGGMTAEVMTFSAFVTNSDIDIPDEGLMTCDMTFKVTGNIEFVTA
jgi:hypothetical protein